MPPTNQQKNDEADRGIASLLLNVRVLVDELSLSQEVLQAVLPGGRPHDFESELWEYKERLPELPQNASDDDRKRHKAGIGDIIKDALALHNAYGGYIVFGIANKGRDRVRGCNVDFDIGDFNKRLEGYTGSNIECLFRLVPATDQHEAAQIGLLLVPRRPTGAPPVRFIRKGPERMSGGRCFNEETYVRIRDECRAATATSQDWLFLHSDRNPPERTNGSLRRPVQATLPARDVDLVKFVGRESTLASLRSWLTDARSPVRLVTGIGGVGKTTVAYRFAEEVAETGAGEIERLIWLTAKQRTFSALRGQMVETNKVDFFDLSSLYDAILKALCHELPLDEEEPTLDQMADRVVDALQNYTCLIVVDDIDSLDPEEQKETVAALNGIALRTVGRDLPASRVLMTSRIDQGMPPTAVIKISGLERHDFDQHVVHLSQAFSIAPIKGATLDSLFDATSGSPLFAASIVRLVKLGERLNEAIETWRGQEGEDVRRFAFEREIKRLGAMEGRLLYAVLLLGETSINDLANVLDVTPKVVRDRISELQAYHLISTATKESGDAIVLPPSDLVAVAGILAAHLGSNAKAVEEACARAQAASSRDNRSIGAGIRRVVAAWNAGRPDEALIIANSLSKEFPKNGDVANVLGQALLRVSPPKFKDADVQFDAARRLGCARPEVISDSIRVKTTLRDWQALYQLTKRLHSNDPARDLPLSSFLQACEELISLAKVRGDYQRVAELAIEAVEKLTAKFSRRRLEKGLFTSLNDKRLSFAREYMRALDRLHTRAGDRLNVFDGIARLAEADVILADLLTMGLGALKAWWSDVEERPVVDLTACSILSRQLKRLEQLERQLAPHAATRSALIDKVTHMRLELAHRGAQLQALETQAR